MQTGGMGQRISLLEFDRRISGIVNGNPAVTNVWTIAELSDFRYHASGHAYGQLIEKDAAGNTVATIRATIWAGNLSKIRRKFVAATGQEMRTGMKVSLLLTANFNGAYGLSANVTDIDPAYSLGDMERIRREILERLRREGLYDLNKRRQLPPNPQKIAVISAAGAAGYGDFMQQLEGSPYVFYCNLYPAMMQGERTPGSVMRALDLIEMAPDFWDCVVIIRGGGATNDLNAFDNYELAARVATYPLPVIVGIGHERDNTVLDYIANTRCKTPTAVAAFLIERMAEAELRVEESVRRMMERVQGVLALERQRVSQYEAYVPFLPQKILDAQRHRLDNLRAALVQEATSRTTLAARRLSAAGSALGVASAQALARESTRLTGYEERLKLAVEIRLRDAAAELDSKGKLVEVLSPAATLKRGYSITRVDGHAVRSVKEIAPGAEVITTLADGTMISIAK